MIRSATPDQPRNPKGAAGAGRFAHGLREEAAVELPPALPEPVDRYGFPVVVCSRCSGTGRHAFNGVEGDVCYGCGGTGHRYAPHVLRQVVAEFAAAQRAATRPRVRDLRVGDVISRPYAQLHEAQFRRVARVLVATRMPTRFEGRGPERRAVAFPAAVDFEDGSRDVVTTDFVYSRRGAEVDPAPYVARAVAGARGAARAARG